MMSYKNPPVATEEGLAAIEASDAVVIGPSNPITSISPILTCEGMRRAIRDKLVIAVSPFLGDTPFSGPAVLSCRQRDLNPAHKELSIVMMGLPISSCRISAILSGLAMPSDWIR